MLFKDLGLSAELLRAVDEAGYREATPIQQRAVPPVLEGRDVLGCAQTGTGKTAGFMLPLLERLKSLPYDGKRRLPRALVLTPTRELAAQVGQSARDYGRYLRSKTAIVYGGVGIHPQIAALRAGPDIIVATPGRLLDHLQQRTVDLSGIEILVLDEADRMLDMGFIRDIRKIMDRLPERRQNLLFSATFSPEIRRLAADLLDSPIEVEATPSSTTVERVRQIVHPVDKGKKRALLAQLIADGRWRQVLVFTRTKHGANRLAEQLDGDGLSAAAIHGNKSQGARTRALAEFKAGQVRVLVATDIAARGLDIDRLPHVVNYELPNVPEDYVHRIGRTARAGQDGTAVSLVCVDELGLLAGIERLLKCRLEREVVAGYEVDPRIRAEPIENGGGARRNRPRSGAGPRAGASSRSGAGSRSGGAPRPAHGAPRKSGGGASRGAGSAKPGGAPRSRSRKRRAS